MILPVVFRRPALRDFEEAALWYEAKRPGLVTEFESEVSAAILAAAEHPTRFPRMLGNVRCVRVRRFPYSVRIPCPPQSGRLAVAGLTARLFC